MPRCRKDKCRTAAKMARDGGRVSPARVHGRPMDGACGCVTATHVQPIGLANRSISWTGRNAVAEMDHGKPAAGPGFRKQFSSELSWTRQSSDPGRMALAHHPRHPGIRRSRGALGADQCPSRPHALGTTGATGARPHVLCAPSGVPPPPPLPMTRRSTRVRLRIGCRVGRGRGSQRASTGRP